MIAPARTDGVMTYNRRPRSLWGNLSSVLLQPISFFRSFPTTRQWVWVALLILIAFGFSAVHQPTASDGAQTTDISVQPIDPSGGGSAPGVISGGGAVIGGGGDGGFIQPSDPGAPTDSASAPDVSKTVMSALLAAGGVLLGWLIQAFALCEVPMINGKRPSLGRNLQIAVWASVPLALMLVIQQIYFAIGGTPGQVGLSLLLERWQGFASLPTFSQSFLTTLATNFTLFWLWNLLLVYLGGRYVLTGKRAAVALVVVMWVIVGALLPTLASPPKSEIALPPELSLSAPNGTEEVMPEMATPPPSES
ncbi:MAG: YIP1 family protein, partial [Chloroflexota bacterium]